jgi:hypothetical protein
MLSIVQIARKMSGNMGLKACENNNTVGIF